VQGAHASVLLAESLELLAVRPGGIYVDGTVGLGGHAAAILERSAPDGRLLGLDKDSEALEQAAERLRPFGDRAREADLADIIYRFGEERKSRRIAGAIVAARRRERIRTTGELAAIVRRAAGRSRPGLDPATRTFQALRIHVNRELDDLGPALAVIAQCLAPRGRMAVIAFHSLEDREVKHTFRELGTRGFAVLTKRPLRPGTAEVAGNPRSRSARLRGLERSAA
jgi:16S rRNA C1402 N4-methylase RsmH